MEALKLIPQSFFEFFARLVPGALALAIFLESDFGRDHWASLLKNFSANELGEDNVTTMAIITAAVAAYIGGQLAAPFGKLIQRVAERIAKTLKLKDEPSSSDYDWLRVNAPEIGALAAKIRAEQTMFYSMAAVLLAGAVMSTAFKLWYGVTGLSILTIACGIRGYTVGQTHKKTSSKLKKAVKEKLESDEIRFKAATALASGLKP